MSSIRVTYIHEDGTRHENLTSEEAMKMYAAAGFTGSIQAMSGDELDDRDADGDELDDRLPSDGGLMQSDHEPFTDVDYSSLDDDADGDDDADYVPDEDDGPEATVSDHGAQHGAWSSSTPNVQEIPRPPTLATLGTPRTQEQAAAEQTAQAALVTSILGVAPPTSAFAYGTEMLNIGKARYREYAREYEDMPPIDECLDAAIRDIQYEGRQNHKVHPMDVDVYVDDGGQTILSWDKGEGWCMLEEEAISRLVTRYAGQFFSGGNLLLNMDPDLRAETLRRHLHRAGPSAKAMQVRTRSSVVDGAFGPPQAFAIVGTGYPAEADADKWMAVARDVLSGSQMRGSVVYKPTTTEVVMRAMWGAPETLDAKVNDIFRVGWQGRSRDNGTMSFKGGGFALRIVCINCTVMEVSNDTVYRKVHKGASVDFLAAVKGSTDGVYAGFEPFAQAWGILREQDIQSVELWGTTYASIPDAIEGAVAKGQITASLGKDVLTAALIQSYNLEPGETIADLVNAVTRCAHEGEWDMTIRDELEREAGRLVPVLAGYVSNMAEV